MNQMLVTPELVNTLDNIIGVNSPFYKNIVYTTEPFTHIKLKIWVWEGDLDTPYTLGSEPTIQLYESKLNDTDNNILFELSDYLKDFKTNNFQYGLANRNYVKFFKYEYDIINNPTNSSSPMGIETISSPTYLINEGWSWDYETVNKFQPLNMSFGPNDTVPTNKYNQNIYNNKYGYVLNETSTLDSTYQDSILSIPESLLVCTSEPYLIVYLSKDGYWKEFTPTGKVMVNNKITKDFYNKGISRRDLFNNKIQHSKIVRHSDTITEYSINTGLLSELEGQYVEEIMYSPRAYLIEFDTNSVVSGKYSKWNQMAVVSKDISFTRKTRINNKSKINYNLVFEIANNKIR